MDALALLAYMIAIRYRSGLSVIEGEFQDIVTLLDELGLPDVTDYGFLIVDGCLCTTYETE